MDRRFLLWSDVVHEYEAVRRYRGRGAAPRHEARRGSCGTRRKPSSTTPSSALRCGERVGRWQYLQIHTEEMQLPGADRLGVPGAQGTIGCWNPPRRALRARDRPAAHSSAASRSSRTPAASAAASSSSTAICRAACSSTADAARSSSSTSCRFTRCSGQQLMLNGTLQDIEELRDALEQGDGLCSKATRRKRRHQRELRRLGFEPGWGRTPAQIRETMELLLDILEAPSPGTSRSSSPACR